MMNKNKFSLLFMGRFVYFLFLLLGIDLCAQTVSTSDLIFRNCYPSSSVTNATIGCGSYLWNGIYYTETTQTSKSFTNARGCDSTAYLNLTVEDWTDNVVLSTIELCDADLPYLWESTIADHNQINNLECETPDTYTRTFTNQRGCDSIVTLTISMKASGCPPTGALKGVFTINSSGTKVYFARGNLQYKASQSGTAGDITHAVAGNTTKPGVWRFAKHQWDWVGDATVGNVYENNVKCDNMSASSTYTGWIDVFAYGTSGYNNKYPYLYSTGQDTYVQNDLTGTYANYDWGVYNAISNGGNEPGLWRTLTSSEWTYLIQSRGGSANNAAQKLGFATVNGVKGLIILPDVWSQPSSCGTFKKYDNQNASSKYTDNVYYTKDNPSYVAGTSHPWEDMEKNGAVFLPSCGYRYTSSNISNVDGYYHSASYTGSNRYPYCLHVYNKYSSYNGGIIRPSESPISGYSFGNVAMNVRLVCIYTE